MELGIDGTKRWYKDKKLHREDGPAIECVNGDKLWYHDGLIHRIDNPAVEYTNGYRQWFFNGKCHRTDGPAILYSNGSTEWYINGLQHRIDGPAVEYFEGNPCKRWYVNNVLYRYETLKEHTTRLTKFFKMIKYKKMIKRMCLLNLINNNFCDDISRCIIRWV